MNFKNIEYLKLGNERQKALFQTFDTYQILQKLNDCAPIVVGTIPINIDVEQSDVDIICHIEEYNEFIKYLRKEFGDLSGFEIRQSEINQKPSIVANFNADQFHFELFGQKTPTEKQDAYLHMLIEYHILDEQDESFKKEIIRLKQSGVKTEPAFAQLLGLKGDPYKALLHYGIKRGWINS